MRCKKKTVKICKKSKNPWVFRTCLESIKNSQDLNTVLVGYPLKSNKKCKNLKKQET